MRRGEGFLENDDVNFKKLDIANTVDKNREKDTGCRKVK